MQQDLTQGNLTKALIHFTVPLIMSGLLQQIFNWVDAFIVGNVEGEPALAAVGATTGIYNLFIMIITGFAAGLSVQAGQRCGRGERETLREVLSGFTVILGAFFLAVAALGILFSEPLLKLLDTPDDIFLLTEDYLRILLVGVPFLTVYNVYSAVLRGLGDSKAPFLAVLISSVANGVLDVLLVAVLRYGVAGAAAATAISQAAMAVFTVIYTVKKYPYLVFRLQRGMFDARTIREGFHFSGPPAIQSALNSAGSLILQRFMNGFGEQTVAAITTAYRVDTLLLLPVVNFGSGIATVVAQNTGAGDEARARKALRVGVVMISAVSVALTVVILLFGEFLISIFGLTPASVEIGARFFHALASFYLIYGISTALRGYLEGTGDMLFSGCTGVASLVVRIVCSYAFAAPFGNMIIAYAEMFSWLVLLVAYLLRYLANTGALARKRA